MASKLVANGNIREMIEAYCVEKDLTPGFVLGKLQTIAENAKYDRDRINAWDKVCEIVGFKKKEPSVIVGQSQYQGDINDTIARLRLTSPGDNTATNRINSKDTEQPANDRESVVCLPEEKPEQPSTKE